MMRFFQLSALSAGFIGIGLLGCVPETMNKEKPTGGEKPTSMNPKPQDAKLPDLESKEWKAKGDDGLKIWDVKEGKGDEVKKGATVTIKYTGWTKDGKVFDSNPKIAFPLEKLIKGWQEGIPGMKPGGVRRLLIPWKMAYGERGSPPDIPAKADLVFEIELFESK